MIKRIIAIIVGVGFIGNAQSQDNVSFTLKDPLVHYRENNEKESSVQDIHVAIKPLSNSHKQDTRLKVVISVFNNTQKYIDFSTDNIQVFIDDLPHHVLSANELKKAEAYLPVQLPDVLGW